MNKITLVHWHVVLLAATCFALWSFFLTKSGLRWPLGPAIFCLVQGLVCLPIVIYHWRYIRGMDDEVTGAILSTTASIIILLCIYAGGKQYAPELRMDWAFIAAIVGALGLFVFMYELARLKDLGPLGQQSIGLTIISTVAWEVIAMTVYHYWDIRKSGDRPSAWQLAGVILMVAGTVCLFKRNAPAPVTSPSHSKSPAMVHIENRHADLPDSAMEL